MQKALYMLGVLNDEDISWFARNGEQRRVSAGTVVVRQGEPIDSMLFVIDGRLEVFVNEGDKIADIGVGEILGEISLIDSRPPSASVRAVEDALLLAVPNTRVRAELDRNLAFSARFYRAVAVFLADRLRDTVMRLGYGDIASHNDDELFEMASELDDNMLDSLHVSGDRLRRLIATLSGRKA